MAINLITFRTFDQDDFKDVVITSSSYGFRALCDDGTSWDITCGDDGIMVNPKPELGEWSFLLSVRRDITICNASKLYGKDGLAASDAEIGLCVLWTSSDSMYRGTFDLGIVKNVDIPQVVYLDDVIKIKSLVAGTVVFRLCFYLHRKSQTNSRFQANIIGTLLGDIDTEEFLFDGGVSFPIVVVYNTKNQPLWDVDCSWEDVSDSFLDTVSIRLNRDHRLYDYIEFGNKKYDENLLREILASALLQIIHKYSESDPDFTQLDSAVEGSVADYVRLYLKGWNIKDYSSLNAISRGLRKKLEEKLFK